MDDNKTLCLCLLVIGLFLLGFTATLCWRSVAIHRASLEHGYEKRTIVGTSTPVWVLAKEDAE